jgi:small subunit ribosomal protein S16
MLMIRLQRTGRRNHPEFRVVVTEHTRGPKSNDFVEIVGSYNPHADTVALKKDRIQHWMSVGAQASDTVHNILISQGVIEGKKRNVLPKKTVPQKAEEPKADVKAAAKEEPKAEAAGDADTPAEETDKKEETVSA